MMGKKMANIEKLQAALRGGAEERDCFEQAFQLGRAALHMVEGGNLNEMPDFARAKIEFYMFLYRNDWEKIALSAANQMIGAISKLQRRTGLKVLTHYVGVGINLSNGATGFQAWEEGEEPKIEYILGECDPYCRL